MQVVKFEQTKEQELYNKHEKRFYETAEMIERAWAARGLPGNAIDSLLLELLYMIAYQNKVEKAKIGAGYGQTR